MKSFKLYRKLMILAVLVIAVFALQQSKVSANACLDACTAQNNACENWCRECPHNEPPYYFPCNEGPCDSFVTCEPDIETCISSCGQMNSVCANNCLP